MLIMAVPLLFSQSSCPSSRSSAFHTSDLISHVLRTSGQQDDYLATLASRGERVETSDSMEWERYCGGGGGVVVVVVVELGI